METLLGLFIGVALSAACGLRVFVPLLFIGVAAKAGQATLAPGFEWIASTPALVAFGMATLVEIVGYLVPLVDHLLDVGAVPMAAIAGTILTASQLSGMSPFLTWSLGLIVGGGAALGTSAVMGAARAAVTATTAGIGNPFFAALESAGSIAAAAMALIAPAVAIAVIGLGLFVIFRRARRICRRKARKPEPVPDPLDA